MPEELRTSAIRQLEPQPRDPVFNLRHPDPSLTKNITVRDPRLQVRGSWKKLALKKAGGVTGRMGFAYFVVEGG